MKKKKTMIARPDKKVIEFEGKCFKLKKIKYKKIDGVEHEDVHIFEEYDPSKEQEKEKYIIDQLSKKIPPKRVVEELLKNMSTSEIKSMYRLLKEKKAKVKRQDGCLGLYIDGGKNNNMYLDIF